MLVTLIPDQISLKKWSKILQPKVELMVQNYQMLKLNYKLSDRLFAKLDSYQNDDLNFNINTNEILSYIISMSEEFRHYANLNR